MSTAVRNGLITLFSILFSIVLGGLAALTLLFLLCVTLDLIAPLVSLLLQMEGESGRGRSGDSSFGSSAAILLVLMAPLAFFLGGAAFSYPAYRILFQKRLGSGSRVSLQIMLSLLAFCVLGGVVATYLGADLMGLGVASGVTAWVFVGAPVIWIRQRFS